MALTQTNYPSTVVIEGGWGSPNNVLGNTPSTEDSDLVNKNTVTEWIEVTGFGFSLPSDAIITDITFTLLRRSNVHNNFMSDFSIQMVIANAVQPQNMADTVTFYSTTKSTATYSGTPSQWSSLSIDSDVINNTGFGLRCAAQLGDADSNDRFYLSTVACAVTYTVGSEFSMKAWNGTAWVNGSLRRWNGTAWESGIGNQVKIWNGSSWVAV